ncbi:MAG TPA: response regulator [Pyrinomonadaceae bacterium]
MKRSILYLDDEAVCLEVFQGLFGGEYDVRTAVTVSEARALLAECPADIVISDQLMPDVEGTEFLREVANKYPTSCRVLLSGTVNVGNVVGNIGKGTVQFFLAKPWTEQQMRRVLERADSYLGS